MRCNDLNSLLGVLVSIEHDRRYPFQFGQVAHHSRLVQLLSQYFEILRYIVNSQMREIAGFL